MRVYVPATDADLGTLLDGKPLPATRVAFAATSALRRWVAADDRVDSRLDSGEDTHDDSRDASRYDDEEVELVALTEAARHSVRLLAGAGGDRRVVLAVDLPESVVTVQDAGPDAGPGQVRIDGEVAVERLAALHVDDEAAAPAVRAAVRAVVAADEGDREAERLVAALDDHDLLWYDPSELAALAGPR